LDVELPGQDYDIATLTTALFRAGLPVTRLEESQPSLEEVFVRLTEGA
jgi:hypothetical protein